MAETQKSHIYGEEGLGAEKVKLAIRSRQEAEAQKNRETYDKQAFVNAPPNRKKALSREWITELKKMPGINAEAERRILTLFGITDKTPADIEVKRVIGFQKYFKIPEPNGIIGRKTLEKLDSLLGNDGNFGDGGLELQIDGKFISELVPDPTAEAVQEEKQEDLIAYRAEMQSFIEDTTKMDAARAVIRAKTPPLYFEDSKGNIFTYRFNYNDDPQGKFLELVNSENVPYNPESGLWESSVDATTRMEAERKEEENRMEAERKQEGSEEYGKAMSVTLGLAKTTGEEFLKYEGTESGLTSDTSTWMDSSGNHQFRNEYKIDYTDDEIGIKVWDGVIDIKTGARYVESQKRWELPADTEKRVAAEKAATDAAEKAEQAKKTELGVLQALIDGGDVASLVAGTYKFNNIPLTYDEENKAWVQSDDKGQFLNTTTGKFEEKVARNFRLAEIEQDRKRAEIFDTIYDGDGRVKLTLEQSALLGRNPNGEVQQDGKYIYKVTDSDVVLSLQENGKWEKNIDKDTFVTYKNEDTFKGEMKDGLPYKGNYTRKVDGIVLEGMFQRLGVLKDGVLRYKDGRTIGSNSWSVDGVPEGSITFTFSGVKTVDAYVSGPKKADGGYKTGPESIMSIHSFLADNAGERFDPAGLLNSVKDVSQAKLSEVWTGDFGASSGVDNLKTKLEKLRNEPTLQNKTLKQIAEMWD